MMRMVNFSREFRIKTSEKFYVQAGSDAGYNYLVDNEDSDLRGKHSKDIEYTEARMDGVKKRQQARADQMLQRINSIGVNDKTQNLTETSHISSTKKPMHLKTLDKLTVLDSEEDSRDSDSSGISVQNHSSSEYKPSKSIKQETKTNDVEYGSSEEYDSS